MVEHFDDDNYVSLTSIRTAHLFFIVNSKTEWEFV